MKLVSWSFWKPTYVDDKLGDYKKRKNSRITIFVLGRNLTIIYRRERKPIVVFGHSFALFVGEKW